MSSGILQKEVLICDKEDGLYKMVLETCCSVWISSILAIKLDTHGRKQRVLCFSHINSHCMMIKRLLETIIQSILSKMIGKNEIFILSINVSRSSMLIFFKTHKLGDYSTVGCDKNWWSWEQSTRC